MEVPWIGVVAGPVLFFAGILMYRHRVRVVQALARLNARQGNRLTQQLWDQDLDGTQIIPGVFGMMAMGFAVTVAGVIGLIATVRGQ